MLYEVLFSLFWLLIVLGFVLHIYRQFHRAALDRNRLLFELKEEVRKLRKSQESARGLEAHDDSKR